MCTLTRYENTFFLLKLLADELCTFGKKGKLNLISSREKKNHTSHVSCFSSSGLLFKQMVWGEADSLLCLLKQGVCLLRLYTEKYTLEIKGNVFYNDWE